MDSNNAPQKIRSQGSIKKLNEDSALLKRGLSDLGIISKNVEIISKDADFWYSKGAALVKLEKYEKAIMCFDEVIKINSKHTNSWFLKGLALDMLEKYDEAIKCYNTVIRVNPKFAEVWKYKGQALADLGKYEEAIKCYDEALRINPEYSDAWNNKVNALGMLRKTDGAINFFDAAIEKAEYTIGDTGPAGGFIFYINPNYETSGWRYLEAAQSDLPGDDNSYSILGQSRDDEDTSLAELCHSLTINGYSDWFLPSIKELNLMYKNLYLKGIGSFEPEFYWSSSESGSDCNDTDYSESGFYYDGYYGGRGASCLDFRHGHQHNGFSMNIGNRVRVVRAFC